MTLRASASDGWRGKSRSDYTTEWALAHFGVRGAQALCSPWPVGLETLEAMLIDRCVSVARAETTEAQDAREANVFRVAALIFNYKYRAESARLLQASERYFAGHPGTKVETGTVVTKGWILGFPRFRDRMERQLSARK